MMLPETPIVPEFINGLKQDRGPRVYKCSLERLNGQLSSITDTTVVHLMHKVLQAAHIFAIHRNHTYPNYEDVWHSVQMGSRYCKKHQAVQMVRMVETAFKPQRIFEGRFKKQTRRFEKRCVEAQ